MAISIKVQPKLTTDNKIDLLSKGVNLDAIQLDKEQKIKARIDSGEITADNFSSLSNDEQQTVELVLFKQYSPLNQDIAKSLSAIEFALCPLVKLFYATVDKSKLTTEQSAYLDSLYALFCKNDMPINDTSDWRYQYLDQQFTQVQNNRQTYFDEKMRIMGKV